MSDGARRSKRKPSAIVQRRVMPTQSLDFFPTPPWATRVFIKEMAARGLVAPGQCVWEPACGEGHMVEPLREFFCKAHASDVHDYGCGYALGSFIGAGLDVAHCPFPPDWIITNPPFVHALAFFQRAIEIAGQGVAFLLRLAWVEAEERFNEIFSKRPPALILQAVERVPMLAGRYDPEASTTMAYAWFVWRKAHVGPTEFAWIAPGQRDAMIKPRDLTPRFVRSIETHPDLFESCRS